MNDNTIPAINDQSIDYSATEDTTMAGTMNFYEVKQSKPQHNNNSTMMTRDSQNEEEDAQTRLRQGRDEQSPEEASDAFADRLSCSLANISYAPGLNHHHNNHRNQHHQHHNHHPDTISFPPPKYWEASAGTATESVLEAREGRSASTESSTESSDARQVTASAATTTNTTTSSGEERESLWLKSSVWDRVLHRPHVPHQVDQQGEDSGRSPATRSSRKRRWDE